MTISTEKLPARTKLSYGLGSVAFGIKEQGFNTFLLLYYNQVVGMPAAWVGAAIMIAMMVDAVADPLIGNYSDHLRSRWGRRHPFMYASAIPLAIAYFLLWSPPSASHEIQFVYLLLMSITVRIAISFYEIPSSALMAEFTSNYDERTSISTYRSVFLAVGMIAMPVFALHYILVPTADQPVGQLNATGYPIYGAIAAVVMLLSVLISSWGTHHRIPTLKAHQGTERATFAGLWAGMKTILLDRTFSSVLLCTFFFSVGAGLANTLGVYIRTYFWQLSAANIAVIVSAAVWGLFLALLVVHLSKRFGKKETVVALYGIALIAITLPVTLGLLGMMPTDNSELVSLLVVQEILLVMCVLAALILAGSMGADVADHFLLKTGKHMEGLMFSTMVMITKMVSGMGIFLSSAILSFIKFPEKATVASVDPHIIQQLGWIYVIGVGSMCFIAIVALSFYPITRASHEKILRDLKEREAN
ncbi:MFS transporter [Stenotrophobium rhamnosiphilum]|uniref:Sugar transporter n=1 Tax=Stenotrophobium rhamnosiphilum TaxID=2029166 RepID=A0A2T5MH20_9GAMM|nr:MFS transporter [Stenotrophobium rhamnosiphilum]PTU31882.1 hypothetical protein CJD38_04130 [Stenotrophobium rhamnosiphilum]